MRVGFAAAFFGVCVASNAAGMDINVVPGPEVSLVVATGEIARGDAERLRQAVRSQPGKQVSLLISSPGGSVGEAAQLAEMVSRWRLPVFVGRHCVSACFLVLAASPERMAVPTSRIGVHSVSRFGAEDETAMAITTAMARAAARYGVPQSIIGRMVTTQPDEVAWLTAAELRAMRVSVVEDAPAQKAAVPLPATPPPPPSATPTAPIETTAIAPTQPIVAFQQGRSDRFAWEQWFSGQVASTKAGAEHWAAQRSASRPASCESADVAFTAGCTEARWRLAGSDARRRIDPEYRRGWNSH